MNVTKISLVIMHYTYYVAATETRNTDILQVTIMRIESRYGLAVYSSIGVLAGILGDAGADGEDFW